MRAARIVPSPAGGRVEVIDVPTLVPGPGDVLVRVRASALNRGEILQASRVKTGNHLPIGVEFAGEVAAVGSDVTAWQVGDRVMGHGNGGQAEYVLAAPLSLMAVPEAATWIDAGAFPNVFTTAHDALITNGEMQKGEVVLVNAASSGIGIAAIRIAQAMGAGAVIATTRSAAKAQQLTDLGVDCVIDVSTADQAEQVMVFTDGRGADIVIDSVGGTVFEDNIRSLAVKGRLVNIGRLGSDTATIDLAALWLKRLKLIGVTFKTRTEEERLACIQACARDLLSHFAEGRLQIPIDRVFPIDAIAEAHDYMKSDQHVGKIVMAVDTELAQAR